uniref:Uncharacterized protein n=1 Tax=Tanacetum cinerariifolium TaxID=118510 RepID=A0A699HX09_TANCI|nr:hypothetical protein [Tanacetum cinerariifolium]
MNPTATQQAALNNALVPSKKRLKIERCNARIAFTKPQKEETYQVTLEALKLSPWCISGKSTGLDRIRESHFMYQADNREISSARKEYMPFPRFTKVIINHFISKDNTISMRNKINIHTSRDDTLLGTLKFVSKTDYHIYEAVIPDGMRNEDIKLSKAYKTYLDYATRKVPPKKARKFKKPASPKLKIIPASPNEPTQMGKRVKRAAKKATTVLTTSVVIRDTFDKFVSKKKAPAKTGRGKGIELLSDAALLEEAHMKKTLKKKVPDEPTGKTKDTSEGIDESDDDHDEDDNDDKDDNDDDDGNDDDSGNDDDGHNVAQDKKDKSDDEENTFEEEDDDVAKELYRDLNITQGLRNTDLTNSQQGGEDQLNASHKPGFVQEEEDAHVTLTTIHDKTKGPLQSSSISSNFTSKLLNLDEPISGY